MSKSIEDMALDEIALSKMPSEEAIKYEHLGDGWYRRGDVISRYSDNTLTVIDLSGWRQFGQDDHSAWCISATPIK